MSKDIFEVQIVPNLVKLRTNVKQIPRFAIGSVKNLSKYSDSHLSNTSSSSITIEYIVDKIESPSRGHRDKIYTKIDENKLYFERPVGFKKIAKLSLEIKENIAKIIVNPTYHRIGKVTIDQFYSPGYHLMDILNIQLLTKGYCLLHSAGFYYKNKGILLIGLSNTGKTSTTLNFVSNYDATYFAEDILVTDGEKFFSCPYSLSPINPKKTDSFSHNIYEKLREYIPLLGHFYKGPIDSIEEIIGKESIGREKEIDCIFVLSKNKKSDKKSINNLDNKAAESLILSSNRAEFTYSSNQLLLAAQYLGLIDVFKAIDTEENIISKLTNNKKLYHVKGDPEYFTQTILNKIQ